MKRSISVCTHAALFTAGSVGLAIGLNAHHARCSAVIVMAGAGFVITAGHGAPDLIHSANAPICASPSFGAPFGIRGTPSSRRMTCINRLFAGSPGTIAAPLSPPLINASREVIFSPPSASAMWQSPHVSTSTGRMLASKNSICCAVGVGAVAVGACDDTRRAAAVTRSRPARPINLIWRRMR
jgi:hypothetical protein